MNKHIYEMICNLLRQLLPMLYAKTKLRLHTVADELGQEVEYFFLIEKPTSWSDDGLDRDVLTGYRFIQKSRNGPDSPEWDICGTVEEVLGGLDYWISCFVLPSSHPHAGKVLLPAWMEIEASQDEANWLTLASFKVW